MVIFCGIIPYQNLSRNLLSSQILETNKSRLSYLYRLGLRNRYGDKMQSTAGIHFNISFPDDVINRVDKKKTNFILEFVETFLGFSYCTKVNRLLTHHINHLLRDEIYKLKCLMIKIVIFQMLPL